MTQRTIGIISGSGIYPQTFIDAARVKGGDVRLVMAAFKNETREELAADVDGIDWFRVGQLGKMIKFFKKEGVTEAVMVGQIAPKNLFDLRPDIRTMMLLARTKEKNAESLFGGIADELEKDGITLLPATTFLEDIMPGEGHVCGPALKDAAIEDARYGFKIAKETSRLDIGQTVVVKDGMILAVEAFEGTNKAICRGGKLGGKGAVVVKVPKAGHDMRFDIPVIGNRTLKTIRASGISCLAIEAGGAILLDRKKLVEQADAAGLAITVLNGKTAL